MLGSVENLIDGADGVQSLRLDGRKACNIKRVGISQAESNKATVCALPSIHLPLTRDGHGCPKLNAQRLCTDAKPTKRSFKGKCVGDFRGIVRFWKGWRGIVVWQSLRLDGKKFDKSKRWSYRKQNATKRQFVPCRQSTSL